MDANQIVTEEKSTNDKQIKSLLGYNLIIDLRNIQLELKCESDIDQFKAKEVDKGKNRIIEDLFDMIFHRKMLYTYYMVSNHNQELPPSSIINSLFSDVAKNNSNTLTYLPYDGNFHLDFFDCISNSVKLEHFAKRCINYAKKHPEDIDRLTFSVIPGFFEYFWCDENNLKFREFIYFALNEDRTIGTKFSRVIFASSELFYNVFDYLVRNEEQIKDLIDNSFIQKSDLPDIEICYDIFNSQKKDFLTSTFNYAHISEIIDIRNQLYFFTESDIDIITQILKSNTQHLSRRNIVDEDYVVYHFDSSPTEQNSAPLPANRFTHSSAVNRQQQGQQQSQRTTLRANGSHSLKGTNNYDDEQGQSKGQYERTFSFLSSESSNLYFLRKLLVRFPTIQIFAENNSGDLRISTILAQQICLSADKDRLVFEKQIEQLRKIEEEEGHGKEWKIQPITRRLREALFERRSHFNLALSSVSKIQNYISKIKNAIVKVKAEGQFFRKEIEAKIIDDWSKSDDAPQKLKSFQKMPKFSKMPKEMAKIRTNYNSIWDDLESSFDSYTTNHKYTFIFDIFLLHDKLLSLFPFSEYLSEKDVIKKEHEFLQVIHKNRNEIEKFCSTQQKNSTISKSDILQNTFFIEKMTGLFDSALNEQTPTRKVFAFAEVFKFIKSLFAQLYSSVNNDEVLKLFALFVISREKNSEKLKSSADYISSFLWFGDDRNAKIFGKFNSIVLETYNNINKSLSVIQNVSFQLNND